MFASANWKPVGEIPSRYRKSIPLRSSIPPKLLQDRPIRTISGIGGDDTLHRIVQTVGASGFFFYVFFWESYFMHLGIYGSWYLWILIFVNLGITAYGYGCGYGYDT